MSLLIRIGSASHLDLVARRTARRLEALRSRNFAAAFAGPPSAEDPPALHQELAAFGPLGCRLKFIPCSELAQRAERFVPSAYSIIFSDVLRKRFDARVRSACGMQEAMRIHERFGSEAFCEPVPHSGDAIWAARVALHTLAYFRFIEMRGGPGYPKTRRLAALSLLSERMIPLGTLRNEPKEWQVLVLSSIGIPRSFP